MDFIPKGFFFYILYHFQIFWYFNTLLDIMHNHKYTCILIVALLLSRSINILNRTNAIYKKKAFILLILVTEFVLVSALLRSPLLNSNFISDA